MHFASYSAAKEVNQNPEQVFQETSKACKIFAYIHMYIYVCVKKTKTSSLFKFKNGGFRILNSMNEVKFNESVNFSISFPIFRR